VKTEAHVWLHLRTRLRGKWWRLEAITPPGVPDVFGFYKGQTIWIELKVGKPDAKRLEPGQYAFICDCLKDGVPVWVVFAHNGVLKWFNGLPYGDPVSAPSFYGEAQRSARVRPVRSRPAYGRPSPSP
jgi:hypothetical protein